MTTTQRGIVASPHYLATRVGTDILQAGGNAFDAAVGVSLAIGVVQPYHSGIGGGANITYHQADGTAGHINARGPAPANLARDLFFEGQQADNGKPNYALVQTGGLASTIPSLLAGLWALHKRRGTLPWADVCSLPQQLAAKGFTADFKLAGAYQRASVVDKVARYAQGTQFAAPISEGTQVQQPQLAETLGMIGKDSRAVYTGELARQLLEITQKHGGVLSLEDLRDYQPQHTQLSETDYRGWTVFAPGLPTIGSVQTQLALKLLRQFELTQFAAGSREHSHLIAEVVKASYRGRAEIDDDASAAALASDENVAKWQAEISLERTQSINFGGQDTSHTSHFCVADADGNVVSQTQTIRSYFGSGVIDPVSGVVLNDSVGDFSLQVGEATTQGITYQGTYNLLAPHREPASSQSPVIAVHPDGDIIAAGAAGGPRIVSATLQALVNQIDFDLDTQLALTMPRVHSHGAVTDVQNSVLETSLRALEHQTNLTDQLGIAQTIRLRGDSWQGGADPRGPGSVGIVSSDADTDAQKTTCQQYGYSYDD